MPAEALLPPVLTPALMPVAELSALRLDGEAFALDDAMVAADEPVTMHHRLAALASVLDPRLIVERESALWAYGFLATAPLSLTVTLRRDARTRISERSRYVLRETNLEPHEVVTIDGVMVTTPARILYDLAFQHEPLTEEVADAVDALVTAHPDAPIVALAATKASAYHPRRRAAERWLKTL